jgi:hypothetical protein
MKLALPVLLGAAGLLAACADYPPPPPPPPMAAVAVPVDAPPSCFYTRDITNHTIGDDRTLFVRIRNGDVYRLQMTNACLAAATSSDPLVMREPPGVNYACRAVDLDISISRGGLSTGIPTPCIVDNMMRLTPAEVAALPDRLRP